MDGFKAFWNANTLIIAVGLAVVAVIIAVLGRGLPAALVGMVSGIAFMWMARPEPLLATDDDDDA